LEGENERLEEHLEFIKSELQLAREMNNSFKGENSTVLKQIIDL
jgi:hypothetical protein